MNEVEPYNRLSIGQKVRDDRYGRRCGMVLNVTDSELIVVFPHSSIPNVYSPDRRLGTGSLTVRYPTDKIKCSIDNGVVRILSVTNPQA